MVDETRSIETVMQAYHATEGTDGWTLVGNMKYVVMWKTIPVDSSSLLVS